MSILANGRLIFMGMRGPFSLIPLQALLSAGATITAIILPAEGEPFTGLRPLPPAVPPPSDLPLLFSPVAPNIVHLAWANNIPVFEVARLDNHSLAGLQTLRPDLICVACFPRLLPPAWLACPPLGGLNLHPSLLPTYRGPAPLFWQFRAGETNTGVTLHFMDKTADTGDIVAQSAVPFPDGITGPAAETLLAQAGSQLLLDALNQSTLPRHHQPAVAASYQSMPQPADLLIPTTWPARRAYNFMRGASTFGPFIVDVSGRFLIVYEALGYEAAGELGQPFQQQDSKIQIQFSPGTLEALTINPP